MVEHDTNGKSPSGRTWGEIAQARDEKLRRANEELSLMGDQEARWWW